MMSNRELLFHSLVIVMWLIFLEFVRFTSYSNELYIVITFVLCFITYYIWTKVILIGKLELFLLCLWISFFTITELGIISGDFYITYLATVSLITFIVVKEYENWRL